MPFARAVVPEVEVRDVPVVAPGPVDAVRDVLRAGEFRERGRLARERVPPRAGGPRGGERREREAEEDRARAHRSHEIPAPIANPPSIRREPAPPKSV